MTPKAIVITGYGVNADAELAEAFRLGGAQPERVHVADLLADPTRLARARFLGFPGGFSFGDHLGSGQVLALLLRKKLKDELERFVADGGFVIGICNGFQTLVKTGLLPDLDGTRSLETTLVHNESGVFVDDWVGVRFEKESHCAWTDGLEPRMLPIRHGEGRFVVRDASVLDRLESEKRVAVRYDDRNPNGSVNDIAGICDRTGRVLGLMPHPEAFLFPENHPYRRRGMVGKTGVELFEKAVRAAGN